MKDGTLQNLDNLMRYFGGVIGCLDRFATSETVELKDAAESAAKSITEMLHILDAMRTLTIADIGTTRVPVKDGDKPVRLVVNNGPIEPHFRGLHTKNNPL